MPTMLCEAQGQQAYILGYLRQFERALFGPGFADPAAGWRQLANQSNALDYFLFEAGLPFGGKQLWGQTAREGPAQRASAQDHAPAAR